MSNKSYKIDKYLSEEKETILGLCAEAIENNSKIHFKAPVGSGKTTAIIDLIQEYDDKQIIVLFPQISISEQVKTKLNNKGIEAEVVNADTFTDVVDTYDAQLGGVFLSTIDSAYKLIEELEMSNENTIVILDETHTFLQSARDNFTRSVEAILSKQFPVIGFSATPSAWVNKFLFGMDKQIEFQFNEERISTIKQTPVKNGVLRTVANEIATNHNGMTVVFMESKTAQTQLKTYIEEYKSTLKVCCLNRDTKTTIHEKEWKYLMQNDNLPETNDVYIINRVAQAGVNITNHDIDRVFLVDYFDPFGFAQYLGRCRNYDKEYYYYNPKSSKQLGAFNWDKIEDRIEFINAVLQASNNEMRDFIRKLLPLITDHVFEDKELNLAPNKCKIAYSVYEQLRELRGEDLSYPVTELFPNIEFEVNPEIDGIVVTSADSQTKRREKAKDALKIVIMEQYPLVNEIRVKMNFEYSIPNMQHVINTKYASNNLLIPKIREDKLNEIVKLLKQAQMSPTWLFTINTLYQQSHKNEKVLDELMSLNNNQVRTIAGAMKFFRSTTKPNIKKLMASMYNQCGELLTAKEWKELLEDEVNIAVKSPKLMHELYIYCMQKKKSNSKLKLIRINESIVDFLRAFNFKNLTVFQGRLAPR